MDDDEEIEALARAIYEGLPSPRSIDNDDLNPIPWDELGRRQWGWKVRARFVLKAGWSRKLDAAQNAVRVAREAVGESPLLIQKSE